MAFKDISVDSLLKYKWNYSALTIKNFIHWFPASNLNVVSEGPPTIQSQNYAFI